MKREPVAVILSAAVACATAVLSACRLLSWIQVDDAQFAAIIAAIGSVATLVGVIIRASVVSPDTHEQAVTDALYSPVPEFFDQDGEGR